MFRGLIKGVYSCCPAIYYITVLVCRVLFILWVYLVQDQGRGRGRGQGRVWVWD